MHFAQMSPGFIALLPTGLLSNATVTKVISDHPIKVK
jgi:hypothetical protein